jgi:hypothetical protein
MKNFSKILFGFLVIAIAAVVGIWAADRARAVEIFTDRQDYKLGDALEVTIANELGKAICFSSCYPYLVEKLDKKGQWEQYAYENCPNSEIAADCVAAGAKKIFRLSLADAEGGMNRLKLPLCVDCVSGQNFSANTTFYSNDFQIIK